jgi:hypothetical protein
VVARSIEHRMRSFVAWHGEVPADAARVEDSAARSHAVGWIRRNLGKGVAGSYVIGFEADDGQWWTLFFDRDISYVVGWEVWVVEGYAFDGTSWTDSFVYMPDEDRWLYAAHPQPGGSAGRSVS